MASHTTLASAATVLTHRSPGVFHLETTVHASGLWGCALDLVGATTPRPVLASF